MLRTRSRIRCNLHWAGILPLAAVSAALLVLHPGDVLLAGVAGAVLFFMFGRPDLTLWALVLTTPLESFGPVTFLMTKSAKLAFATVSAAALYCSSANQRQRDADPYGWPFLLVLLSGLFSTLLARSPWSSLTGLASIMVFVCLYESAWISGALARKGHVILQAVIWLGVVCSLLCLAQLLFGYDGILGSPEQRTMQAEGVMDTFWPDIQRGSATLNGPSAAGAFCAIAGVIAWTRALHRFSKVQYLLVALCAGGVLATFTRGALLGLFSGCGFASWWMGWLSGRRLGLVAAVVTPLLIVSFGSEDVRNYLRLGSDLVSVSESRVDAWQATRTILARHPVLGIGFYEFREIAQGIEGFSDTPLHPHNGFLKALVEEGPIGGLGYLLYLAAFLKTSWRAKKQNAAGVVDDADRDWRWVQGSIAGAGAGLFTQEMFDANLTIGGSSIAILFAILLAIQVSLLNRRQPETAVSAGAFALGT